jgi:hypothetical protein
MRFAHFDYPATFRSTIATIVDDRRYANNGGTIANDIDGQFCITIICESILVLQKMSTRNNDNVDQPRPQLVDIPPKNSVCYYVLSGAYVLQVYDDWSPSTRSCSSSGGDAPDDDDDDSGIASIFNNTGKYRRKSPMNGSVVMKCASSVDDGECAKSTVDQNAYEMCHMRTSLHRIE